MQAFGIDIGGSGIKGAPVDLETGALAGERLRLETPLPATPDAVAVEHVMAGEATDEIGTAGADENVVAVVAVEGGHGVP